MNRRWIALTAAAAAVVLSVVLWRFAGRGLTDAVLRPILREMGTIRRSVERLPQMALWLAGIGFASLVAFRVLLRHVALPRRSRRRFRVERRTSDMERLARSIARRRAASRRHVARELMRITALLLARERGITPAEAMQTIRRGEVPLPAALTAMEADEDHWSWRRSHSGNARKYLEAIDVLERGVGGGGFSCS